MTKKHWFDFSRWVIDAEVSLPARLGVAGPAQTRRRKAAAALRLVLVPAVLGSAVSLAQKTATRQQVPVPVSLNDVVRALSEQVQQLQETVAEMRRDSQQARAETRELQREIDELRAGRAERRAVMVNAASRTESKGAAARSENLQENDSQASDRQGNAQMGSTQSTADREEQKQAGRAASLEEEYELLSGKVDDQYQTKVESASKYRMRISGIVLTNLFSNQGTVDNADLPMLAYPRPAGDRVGALE